MASQALECPRCHLPLRQETYEGHPVQFCGECWGHWVSKAALLRILKDDTYHFSRQEREIAFRIWAERGDADRTGRESEPIACPLCGEPMQRLHLVRECPVLVDQCEGHGVWLDTGELKELQIFVENQLE